MSFRLVMAALAGSLIVAGAAWAEPAAAAAETDEAFWLGGEGYACKPTIRQEVFEFTADPAVRRAGRDQYEISFASKGLCDATVEIVRPSGGRIVRHLASGVLGPNAPDPFQPNSLAQKIIWDGKDDMGQYVRDVAACQVRVNLGLKPSFAGLYGWHPKDTASNKVRGLAAGPEGVLMMQGGIRPQIRLFDHAGQYVRTVYPPPATITDEQMAGMQVLTLPDGRRVLRLGRYGYGGLLQDAYRVPVQSIGFAAGRVVVGNAGHGTFKRLFTIDLATGGSVNGRMSGPPLNRNRESLDDENSLDGGHHLAVSPDGKWIYLSGLHIYTPGRNNVSHAVYRLPFENPGPLGADGFFGEDFRAANDNEHLSDPAGINCDPKGRLYVADRGNGRIVVLSPEGRFLKAIPCPGVRHVAIHHRTGAIYAMAVAYSGSQHNRIATKTILRMASLDDPTVQASTSFACPRSDRGIADLVLFALDSWADPPVVWLTRAQGGIVLLTDRGKKFEQTADWQKEVAAAGLIPGEMYDWRMPKVVADPVRPLLYYHPDGWGNRYPYRFNTETGKSERITLPSKADDIAFDAQGRLYCRAFRCLSRHDADDPKFREIPFDYGEPVEAGGSSFGGALPLPDMLGAKFYQDGFGVGVDGRIAVLSNFYSWGEFLFYARGDRDTTNTSGFDSVERFKQIRADYFGAFKPLVVTPGRNMDNQALLNVFNPRGEPIGADLIKGPISGAIGAAIDRDGNVYVEPNLCKVVDGKSFFPQYVTATLVKASPKGARILGDWGNAARAKLDPMPDRPPDFTVFVASPNTSVFKPGTYLTRAMQRTTRRVDTSRIGAKLWQTGLLWAYPGVSEQVIGTGACTCNNNRFSLDYHGRCFVPEAYRYSVGVVDANGNRIMHIGRYGNADSGRGPDSPVKVGGDELAFSFSAYLSAIDGYLFVSDAGSNRIVRVRLGYHQQRALDLPAAGG